MYGVRVRAYASQTFTIRGLRESERSDKHDHYRAEVFLREGGQQCSIVGYQKSQVIGDILDQYEKHLHFLHLVR